MQGITCWDPDTSSANSIGITKVCGNTAPLLPKALQKPSSGVAFLFSAIHNLIEN